MCCLGFTSLTICISTKESDCIFQWQRDTQCHHKICTAKVQATAHCSLPEISYCIQRMAGYITILMQAVGHRTMGVAKLRYPLPSVNHTKFPFQRKAAVSWQFSFQDLQLTPSCTSFPVTTYHTESQVQRCLLTRGKSLCTAPSPQQYNGLQLHAIPRLLPDMLAKLLLRVETDIFSYHQ